MEFQDSGIRLFQFIDPIEVAVENFFRDLQDEGIIKEINEENASGYQKSLELLLTKANGQFIEIEEGSQNELGRLEQVFYNLALSFIYGGHIAIRINGKLVYNIHIDAVEFYFHCEGERGDGELNVKDPVYHHRDGSKGSGTIPFLPLLSLYVYNSKMYISLENVKAKYRSVALVDSYTVTDGKGMIISQKQTPRRLSSILNGFFIIANRDSIIKWDNNLFEPKEFKKLLVSYRYNVFESSDKEDYKEREYDSATITGNKKHIFVRKPKSKMYLKKDIRLWQFRRPRSIEIPLNFLEPPF